MHEQSFLIYQGVFSAIHSIQQYRAVSIRSERKKEGARTDQAKGDTDKYSKRQVAACGGQTVEEMK
jgi:hypothetical protein